MATLYEFKRGGRATISQKVKDQKKDVSIGSLIVPQLSMKQICERYFFKKVNFFTIDVEGMASLIFQSNDWSNPLCVPEFIIVEDNKLNDFSGLRPIPEVLTEKGYVQLANVRTNAVYVLK